MDRLREHQQHAHAAITPHKRPAPDPDAAPRPPRAKQEDHLRDEALFASSPGPVSPEPYLRSGLITSRPPVPKGKDGPVYRRCLIQPEQHASDGQYDGSGQLPRDFSWDVIWIGPGEDPPGPIAAYWDSVLAFLDKDLAGPKEPSWAQAKSNRGMQRDWKWYDDDRPRAVSGDPYLIRAGRVNASRDIFALGGVIIKSNHRHEREDDDDDDDGFETKYLDDDFREVNVRNHVIRFLPRVMEFLPPPRLYFVGRLRGKNVLVVERVKGTSMSRIVPRIGADGMLILRGLVRDTIRLLASRHSVWPDHFLMHAELMPHNIILAFGTGRWDERGCEAVTYIWPAGAPVPVSIRLAGLIDWKEVVMALPREVMARHRMGFWGGREEVDELVIPANASDEQLKTKIWHDLYVGAHWPS